MTDHEQTFGEYDYEADIARGSNIRKPGERPWEAAQRMRRERIASFEDDPDDSDETIEVPDGFGI